MGIGTHITWDLYNCDSSLISFVQNVEVALNSLVDEIKLSKVDTAFKQFEPFGVTGFILLEESHVSIHTWPEHNFAAVDLFSCNTFNSDSIQKILKQAFNCETIIEKQIKRGELVVAKQMLSKE